MITIVIKEEKQEPRDFNVDKFPVSIGRSKDNAIRVPSPFLSREHCRIEKTPKGYRVVDLDSKNGLSVNGQAVKASDLVNGDVITIGNNTFTMKIDSGKKPYKEAKPAPKAKKSEMTVAAKGMPDDEWKKQLSEEDIAECSHCKTLFSTTHPIPGVGLFCPSCKTTLEV